MNASSFVQIEFKGHFPPNHEVRPFDVQWSPEHGLGDSAFPQSPFTLCGADLTIDHSPEPPPAFFTYSPC
eukprot:scaffold2540_cov154-Skeletonema_menzelii.AAC.3